jgi:hypothetical protein
MEVVVAIAGLGLILTANKWVNVVQAKFVKPRHCDCPHCHSVIRVGRTICPACARYL